MDLVRAMSAGAEMRNADLSRRNRAYGDIGSGLLELAKALQGAEEEKARTGLDLASVLQRQRFQAGQDALQRTHGEKIAQMGLDANAPARNAELFTAALQLAGGDWTKAAQFVEAAKNGRFLKDATVTVPSTPVTVPPRPASVAPSAGGMAPIDSADFSTPPSTFTPPPTTRTDRVFAVEGMPNIGVTRANPDDRAAVQAQIAALRSAQTKVSATNPEQAVSIGKRADALEASIAETPRSIFADQSLSDLSDVPPAIRLVYEALAQDIAAGGNPSTEIGEALYALATQLRTRESMEDMAASLGGGPLGLERLQNLVSRKTLARIAAAAAKRRNG